MCMRCSDLKYSLRAVPKTKQKNNTVYVSGTLKISLEDRHLEKTAHCIAPASQMPTVCATDSQGKTCHK